VEKILSKHGLRCGNCIQMCLKMEDDSLNIIFKVYKGNAFWYRKVLSDKSSSVCSYYILHCVAAKRGSFLGWYAVFYGKQLSTC
jgi:hypothetical protein